MDAREVINRLKKAQSRRSLWVQTWQDIYYLAMPMLENFFFEAPGTENMDQIIDETAVVGVQEFASKLQHGIVPNNVTWFRFEPGSKVPKDQRQTVQAELDLITEAVAEAIHNSNFSTAVPEAFLDLAVGTGNLICDEGPADDPIRFEAASLTQMYLLSSSYNCIDHIFRKRTVKGYEIEAVFPDATIPETLRTKINDNPMCEEQFVQSVIRDWSAKDAERWEYSLIWQGDTDHTLLTETYTGQGSNPWINFRWMVRANEVWGRGPMYFALPAIRTVNLTQRLILENAEMAISGLWQQDDDGVVNVDTIELVPGTVIPRAPGSRGLEPINSASRFDVGQMVVADMRENIRRDLYILDLGPTDTTPMSATEVAARQADIAERIGSAFGRLQKEFVTKVLERVVFILKKQGKIKIPKIDGKEIKIVPISPLARAQRNDEILKLSQFAGMAGQMLGPQGAQLFIKPEAMLSHLARWYEIPADVMTTEEERQAMMQQTAQAAATLEAEQPGAAAEVAQMAQQATA